MTALEQLNRYLRRVEFRLRLFAASRGFALLAGTSLLLTLLLVWISNRFQFAQGVVMPLRILLFLAVAAVISFALAIPLSKLTRKRVTSIAERDIPGFGERLLTAVEKPDSTNPFTELVAEEALGIAQANPPESLKASGWLWGLLGGGAVAAGILVWLIAAGPGFWGYGASLLWTGSANHSKRPLYDIAVQPGNRTIRRKSDQAITARLEGFSADKVVVHARRAGGLKWEEAVMEPAAGSSTYRFLFANVSDPMEYYVRAGASESKHFRIAVKDLPAVKRVKVRLHYPSALGLQDVSEDPGGDIRTVIGSKAEISVLTNRPLEHGVLELEGGKKAELRREDGNWLTAEIPIERDGSYHVAAIDGGEAIRISDDYFIEAKKDEAPLVKISRPGGDPHVSPIEEVPVTVESSDDFGVKSLDLHYSVNGGAEQVTPFRANGGKEVQGKTTIYLENFRLAPGDVISLYATARDANTTARSDMLFAQAEAFDYKFSQSQQAGGGMNGGGGAGDSKISERQKQIIAATWNELRSGRTSKADIQEHARFLSDTEGKLGAQAKVLAERMGNRELAGGEFENFSKLMTAAAAAMNEAVGQLSPAKWQQAMGPEQKALQSLLRAEALFRDIQVAFGQRGGGAGSSGAQRDLARMFDLELDTTKNQYETGQNNSQSEEDKQKAIDDAFQRLQMLAKRQQELAQQRSEQQPAEQRWQEEQLRREAEELRRQMEQLARNSQGQGQQGQQSAGSQQRGSQATGQGSQSGGTAGGGQNAQANRQTAEAMRQAQRALAEAENEMRKAVGNGDASSQRRAAAELGEAQKQLGEALHRGAASSVADLSQKAQEIASAQRDAANRLKQLYGQQGLRDGSGEMSGTLGGGEEMPEMNDPDHQSFSYGYRRRFFPQLNRPLRQASEGEKAIARDKEKLAAQLEQLQREMEGQQQSLTANSPDAAAKMRRALSDAEQKELALRMQKNAQWIREGYGDRNLGMEDNVTAGVEQLSRDLHGVQQALQNGEGGAGKPSDSTQRALAQVRALREMLERAQAGQRANGQPSGQPSGQAGQQGGRQGGASQSGGTEAGSRLNGGQAGQGGGSGGGDEAALDRQGLQEAMGQLRALRGQIGGRDRALGDYLGGTLGYLRDLNADPNVLHDTIGQDAMANLERLEMELSRRVGEQQAKGARTGAGEASPEKYRDAVADYFKKLSQPTTR